MKKPALTILMLLLTANVVSACELSLMLENYDPVRKYYDEIFLPLSFALLIPIVILYFLKKRKGIGVIVAALSTLALFVPLMILDGYTDRCRISGSDSVLIRAQFFFMLFIFVFQIYSWITQRSKLKAELP